MRILIVFLLALSLASPAWAVDPAEILKDSVMEKRARSISKGLRCVVCQNQSIDDSDAQLARDLRLLVRERLMAGDGDQEVVDYVVSRYGDFVLLRPPVKSVTFVLWYGPAIIALLGLFGLIFYFRRQKSAARVQNQEAVQETPLSAEEQKKLDDYLNKDSVS